MLAQLASAAHEVCPVPEHRSRRRLIALSIMIAVLLLITTLLLAQGLFARLPDADREGQMERWLAATAHQEGTIASGTAITTENWRQYRQFMPMGMQELFEGRRFWKMPKEAEMDVGSTVLYPLPPSYNQATRDYSAAVRVAHLPGGRNDIANYVAGEPFPESRGTGQGVQAAGRFVVCVSTPSDRRHPSQHLALVRAG